MFRLRLAIHAIALALTILVLVPASSAQTITATLTGTVTDTSQAVVPNAAITVKNEQSGDIRRTVTNGDGYYTIAALPAGTYSVFAESPGFGKVEKTGVAFLGGDKKNVDIILTVAAAGTEVQISAAADSITPVDSGEKSATLTTKQLQDYSVVGRSAAEFIKVLPGFAISGTGTENRANFTGEVIGINGNGEGGSQSALNGAYAVNGLPNNSLDITADGAHVSDPGCNCATPVNPNTDMIQEFKVLTSNFSAENAKGPAVINTIAKSGSHDFHGEGYFYARNYVLNANDALNNKLGQARPENKYYFPGGNIGGPVLIPGTNFNKNRDKVFFFSGFEYYYQTLDTGLITATVPTAAMRNGDFSRDELAKLGTITSSGGAPQNPYKIYPNGIVPASDIDPGGKALLNLLPLPNANPNATGGYNYVQQETFNQNSWQWLTRVDYSISDNTKLFVRYNLQKEKQLFPVGLWWRNGGTQLPYPTPIVGKNQSQSISASLTHVFSPSLTNEFVFGYTYIDFPNVFQDPKKVDRTALGYPYHGLYNNKVKQIPSIQGWGGDLATVFNPGGFEAGGAKGLFADKYLPSVSDNLTKVWGTHTMKFGMYFEYVINDQPNNGLSNGRIIEGGWQGNSTGSSYADLLTGRVTRYDEQNFNNLHNEAYKALEFYAQDSWKATRRLTVEYGLRASHLGNWYDRQGDGFAVWDPSTYNSTGSASAYDGFTWHKRNSSIPLGGFPNKAMLFAPRIGLAYDLFGSGKTVLRGGWGEFFYHNAQFTTGLDAPAGVQTQFFQNVTLSQIDQTNPANGAIGTGGVTKGDNSVPKTYSYSFSVSQRIPGSALLELSYVGNQSSNLLDDGGVGSKYINAVPYGTFLNSATDPNNLKNSEYDAKRPFPLYQDLQIVNHRLYQNYNAFQASLVRTKGRYDYSLNYTFGKSLGVVGGDQLNLNNDYGPLGSDRRHIFNAAYSIELGSPFRSNLLAKGLVNGWQLSGITQWQSGINLTANTGNNFNLNTNSYKTAAGYNVSSRTINGTDSVPLQPLLTCNPASGLGKDQYVNGNCFAIPTTPGNNGGIVLPEVFGPAFFNSDLSLFKNFVFSESKKLQFRFSTYNFLNHPLPTFRGGSSNLKLSFDGATGKLNNPNFGVVTEKQGHRIVQLALKFYF